MKKTHLLLFFAILFISINSCKKDEQKDDDKVQFTADGLVKDFPAMHSDTIVVNSSMNIDLGSQTVDPTDHNATYNLQLSGFDSADLQEGKIIIDYNNDGRIWVIKQVNTPAAPGTANRSVASVIASIGSVAHIFTNCIVETSTAGNRAKAASNNPDKLGWAKFKMMSADGTPTVDMNLNNINVDQIEVANGINFSVNANTVTLDFDNYQVYSNTGGTFNVTIPSGSVKINNALDLRMKFNPLQATNPTSFGSIKKVKTAIYSDVDADISLNLEATTNGVNSVVDHEEVLGTYRKLIVVPPYIVISVKVAVKAKLSVDIDASLNVTPHFVTKNNYEMRANYDGEHLSNSNIQTFHQNLLNSMSTSVTGDFNLTQRLEIYPEVDAYIYGLIGPSGKIIPYETFEANAHLNNTTLTWDAGVDIGLDYEANLDISLFHIDAQTSHLASTSGNFFNTNIYKVPNQSSLVSGNNQTALGGNALPDALRIKVTDNLGNGVPLTPVFFESTTGGGSFDQAIVLTDSNGFAQANWTLGNTAGAQAARAYVKDGQDNIINATTQVFNATASGTTSAPSINTVAYSHLTANSVTTGGEITGDGGSPITASGVCYSTNPNPTTADNPTNDGTATGTFESILTGLTPNTTYYVRAYATNANDTAYGNEIQFTTSNAIPIVETANTVTVSSTSATSGGTITSDGGSAIVAKGVCWSTAHNPTTADQHTDEGAGSVAFGSTITGLSPSTTYYVRAYATNANDTGYGSEMQVTTFSGGAAPVADFTASQTNISTGTTVNFTDASTNSPTSWSWTFAGGTPSSSTDQNPSVTYNTAGTYDVILTATNADGSDTETKTGYITVSTGTPGTFPGQTVLVNGGTFQMGSSSGTGESDEHPQHSVTVSSFRISKYEITNQQYADFMNAIGANSDGSYNGTEYLDVSSSYCKIDYTGGQFVPQSGLENYPVVEVSWYGAKAYAEYYGGRLPTEAEWEFAARGGNSSNGYTYSGSDNIDDVAWYSSNSGSSTHTVGTKNANELGIYDMSGNVWEWCYDWYDSSYYSSSPSNDPQGPSSGAYRVFRGGSWYYGASYCRVANRGSYYPTNTNSNLGFRPVFAP